MIKNGQNITRFVVNTLHWDRKYEYHAVVINNHICEIEASIRRDIADENGNIHMSHWGEFKILYPYKKMEYPYSGYIGEACYADYKSIQNRKWY